MYDDISIVVLCDGKMVYGAEQAPQPQTVSVNEKKPAQRKGFFTKLFDK